MKIQIIGFSGSGKSTLAKRLGLLYNIPYLHLDNTRFYGDWQERTREEQTEIVKKFLEENDNWVIDGNYQKICPERFEQTDMTIFLDFNRFFCYKAAKERAKKHKFVARESCACPDKWDLSFRWWLLVKGRTLGRRKKIIEKLNMTKSKKIVLKNRKQLENFVSELEKSIKKD